MIARAALLLAGAIFAAAPAMAQPEQAPRPPERPGTVESSAPAESLPPPERPVTREGPDRPDIRPPDAGNSADPGVSQGGETAGETQDEGDDAPAESRPPPERPGTAEDPDRSDIHPPGAENSAGRDAGEAADESEDAPASLAPAEGDTLDSTAPSEGPNGSDGAAADEGEDTPAAQVFGPPMPPRYQALREGDDEYAACLLALSMLGTDYQPRPTISDDRNRDCGIARPLHVSRIVPGVELEGGALMRCGTARALGFWVRDFVRPAAAALPGAPQLRGLQLGTTYDCRARVGTQSDAGLSEHAFGNAIDIMGFRLEGGADDLPDILPVQPRSGDGDMAEAFQRAVRASACLWFDTVMGPGSNAAHDDHLHLDVIGRDSLWRLCD